MECINGSTVTNITVHMDDDVKSALDEVVEESQYKNQSDWVRAQIAEEHEELDVDDVAGKNEGGIFEYDPDEYDHHESGRLSSKQIKEILLTDSLIDPNHVGAEIPRSKFNKKDLTARCLLYEGQHPKNISAADVKLVLRCSESTANRHIKDIRSIMKKLYKEEREKREQALTVIKETAEGKSDIDEFDEYSEEIRDAIGHELTDVLRHIAQTDLDVKNLVEEVNEYIENTETEADNILMKNAIMKISDGNIREAVDMVNQEQETAYSADEWSKIASVACYNQDGDPDFDADKAKQDVGNELADVIRVGLESDDNIDGLVRYYGDGNYEYSDVVGEDEERLVGLLRGGRVSDVREEIDG